MIDPATASVLAVTGGMFAVMSVASLVARFRPDESRAAATAAQRAQAGESLVTAAGLPARLAALEDLPDRGRAVVGAHPPAATADLVEGLAAAAALREDALRRTSDALRGAEVLRRSRVPRERPALAARRAIHDADVAVRRLEDLADRVADRAELLSGGRERIGRALEEHEARLAAIAELSERESLRLTRAGASGAPGPLEAATRQVQVLRADVEGPHPSHRALTEALAVTDAAMQRLERDVERARWEAGRS